MTTELTYEVECGYCPAKLEAPSYDELCTLEVESGWYMASDYFNAKFPGAPVYCCPNCVAEAELVAADVIKLLT